jgi:hypothetical protein
MTAPLSEEYIRAIIQVAERDPSIGRVLREICALDDDVRGPALDIVGAHLRTQAAAPDVLECVQALRREEVARAIAARLGPPG